MVKLLDVFVVLGGLIAAAVTVPGCSSENPRPRTVPAGIECNIESPGGVRSLDLFIYRDTLTRPLESHLRLDAPLPESIHMSSSPGDRLLVAIANSPAPFREEALQRYDAAGQLEMHYREEDPDYPLMSSVLSFSEGPVKLQFTPLLCPVRILHINNLSGRALSGARVQLRGVNSHVQMLRTDGFRSVENESNPATLSHPEIMYQDIPGTIGSELSTPGLILYCYPFDGEGPTRTEIMFSAIADGESKEWSFPLPPLSRSQAAAMELTLK
ncbi:MAG: hypothetical protein II891_07815 [Bacteroidales bacterium]|nr:hypothetical protein [Bacteroidales bacterium]